MTVSASRNPLHNPPDNRPDDRPDNPRDDAAAAPGHGRLDPDPGRTTDHLRRLWEAGGRNITVTYDETVVRHRNYLTRSQHDG